VLATTIFDHTKNLYGEHGLEADRPKIFLQKPAVSAPVCFGFVIDGAGVSHGLSTIFNAVDNETRRPNLRTGFGFCMT
jgi:hypothetical protein